MLIYICLSSLLNYLFKYSAQFLLGCLCFHCVIWVLYIYWTKDFYQIYNLQTFSHSLYLIFTFVIICSEIWKLLISMAIYQFFTILWVMILVLNLRTLCPSKCHDNVLFVIIWKLHSLKPYIEFCDSFSVNACMWTDLSKGLSYFFFFFTQGYVIAPAPSVEKTVLSFFPHWKCLCMLVKNKYVRIYNLDLFLDFQFCSITACLSLY